MNITRLLLTLGVIFGIGSCAYEPAAVQLQKTLQTMMLEGNEPEYALLMPSVLVNPSPSAIVGQWFEYSWYGPGESIVQTMLVLPDGTGHGRVNVKGNAPNESNDQTMDMKWVYKGNGAWTITTFDLKGFIVRQVDCRTTGKELLVSFYNPGASKPMNVVWVRADDPAAVAKERAPHS